MATRFQPTPEQRKIVRAMAGYGIPQADICLVLAGIDLKTLRKHFRTELDTGGTLATAKVAENLYRMATGPGREAVTAAIFWLKTRARWQEVSRLEHTSPDGTMTPKAPTQIIIEGE